MGSRVGMGSRLSRGASEGSTSPELRTPGRRASSSKPLPIVFMANARLVSRLCRARIGQSARFCTSISCTTAAHRRKGSKFTPQLGYYYAPSGMEEGNPTALMNKCILAKVLFTKFKDAFSQGIFTPKQWVDKFTEANYIAGSQYDSDEEGLDHGKEEGDTHFLAGAPYRSPQSGKEEMLQDMSLESTSNLGDDKFDHFNLDAMGKVEEGLEWEHTACAPQAALVTARRDVKYVRKAGREAL